MLCGSGSANSAQTAESCLTLSDGQWQKSHDLLGERLFDTSWVRPDGKLLLIGGRKTVKATEFLDPENSGASEASFDLEHDRM